MSKQEWQGLEGLRAEVQRKLAAQLDVEAPDLPEPPAPHESEVERISPARPRPPKPSMESLRADARRHSVVNETMPRRGPTRINRRWRLSPARAMLVLIALGAGGLAAFLATQHETAPQPLAAKTVKVDNTPVREARARILVASQPITAGSPLGVQSVKWEDWPAGAVTPQYITQTASPNGPETITGSLARFEILAGDPIRKDKLVPAGTGYLAAILAKGMVGVSVPIAAESASGGFIVPNNHVDVVLTRAINGRHEAETIATNVRVLAINAKLANPTPAKAPEGGDAAKPDVFSGNAIATLELDPAQAQVITSATAMGKLSMVLRASGDSGTTGQMAEQATNAQIRLSSPFWTADSQPGFQAPH